MWEAMIAVTEAEAAAYELMEALERAREAMRAMQVTHSGGGGNR